jgi:DNA polymerase-3 subunit gamma/tau
MSYKALYLTYRPQTFEEVAGQKAIVRTLKNALASGKMAHAYLFAGPRGTGKTTMARLFAKALDCEEGLGHQCNKCSNCLAISEGSHPDVIEIDAASNNGVDQVRDLIDKVKYAPIKGKYKVYIIDEVHMMSTGAFNALLKTLEEPPENVIFILCTTEPYKVLPTILSRCQRFDFSKLSDEEMRGKLLEVLTQEKTVYDEEGVKAVIALADGGMRDALSILDQVLAYSGNQLHEKDVLAIYGLASLEEKITLLQSLKSGDVSAVIAQAENFISGGIDVRRLVSDLISLLKDLLIYEKTGDPSLIEDLSEEQAQLLSKTIGPASCNAMITTLLSAQNDFKNVSDVRSLFELTLLRLSSTDTPEGDETIHAPIKPLKKEVHVEPAPVIKKPAEAPKAEAPKPVEESQPAPKAEPVEAPKAVEKPIVVEAPAPKEEPKAEPVQPAPEKKAEVKTEAIFEAKPTPKVEITPQKPDETTPPDWLFGDDKAQEKETEEAQPVIEKPAPEKKPAPKAGPASEPEDKPVDRPTTTINISNILKPGIATEGMQFELPDDEIVKIMVLADKAQRTSLAGKWHHFADLKADPKIGALASLLSDGHPFCICKDAIILSYNFTKRKKEANIMANQQPLSELLAEVIGRQVFVYAIDRIDANRLTAAFFNLQQINKLPRKQEVQLNLPIGGNKS